MSFLARLFSTPPTQVKNAGGKAPVDNSVIPEIKDIEGLNNPRLFVDLYSNTTDEEWLDLVSIPQKNLPLALVEHPDGEVMRRIHGGLSMRHSMGESLDFHNFVKGHPSMEWFNWRKSCMLDYGCGWGRICRHYLRVMPFTHIDGFEPSIPFAVLARKYNPFVTFYNGGFYPDSTLPAGKYELIVSWSVFSHLPEDVATLWLEEFCRISRPGAMLFLTTWGETFLRRLKNEQEMLSRGEAVDWYSQTCINAGGDLEDQLNKFLDGEFIFFDSGCARYGDTFVSRAALERILTSRGLPLHVVQVDDDSLSQTVLVLRRQ